MPNTLAHFGVQGFLGYRFLQSIDPKWILLGCVIPDIPWTLQRVLRILFSTIDLYALRLFAIGQASLFGCLLLAGGLAFLSAHPKKIFGVLAANAFLHLVLDSSQLKWANGVHLLTPFSWELWNLGWYWPESVVTYGMTALGFVYIVFAWRRSIEQPLMPTLPSAYRSFLSVLLLVGYVLFPVAMMDKVEQADNHFVKTLRETESRVGRVVSFDRVAYIKQASGDVIQAMSNEYIKVVKSPLTHSALVSMKGRFATRDTVTVDDLHVHSSWFRDAASIIGLTLFLLMCVLTQFRKRENPPKA